MECKECRKRPSEISEYIDYAKSDDTTPEEFVRTEEGTFNPTTGLFYCTECYLRIGMPAGTA